MFSLVLKPNFATIINSGSILTARVEFSRKIEINSIQFINNNLILYRESLFIKAN